MSAGSGAEHLGDRLHLDVKKLGQIPDGGGWRFLGREHGNRNLTSGKARSQLKSPKMSHLRPHCQR